MRFDLQKSIFIRVIIEEMKIRIFLVCVFLVVQVQGIVDRTYFNYLGLKISASPQEVQQAYEHKLRKIEALENQEEKNKKLKLLQEAYNTLSNQKDRQKYQRYGKDVFRSIKEMTCIDKRNPENPRDQRKSPSFKLTIPVSIADIYNGTIVKAKFPRQTACPVCQGTGAKSPKDLKPCHACSGKGFSLREENNFYGQKFQAETICPVCKGSGKTVVKSCEHCKGTKLISKLQTIDIPIQKGLPDGNKFTLRNYGEQPLLGAPSDFEITVLEIPTQKWSRQGNNLVYLMEISLEESLFGFTKQFEHLDGEKVTVEREGRLTTKDMKHLIKDRGISTSQGRLGNLIVKFRVVIPEFSTEQLNMWEDFFYEHPM